MQTSDYGGVWTGAEHRVSYDVVFDILHEKGYAQELVSITSMPLEDIGIQDEDTGLTEDAGLPVSAGALLSVGIVGIAVLSFGAYFAAKGMLVVSFIASFLILIGWLPLPWPTAAFLITISVLWIAGDNL